MTYSEGNFFLGGGKNTSLTVYAGTFTTDEAKDYLAAPVVFFGSSGQTHSFSTDRNAFMGNYRDESNPLSVERHACGNETIFSGEPCFALQVRKVIPAGQSVRVSWFLGISENGLIEYDRAMKNAARMAALGRDAAWLDEQKAKLAQQWERYLNVTSCKLPDAELQRMISYWAPINCMTPAR